MTSGFDFDLSSFNDDCIIIQSIPLLSLLKIVFVFAKAIEVQFI